MMTRMLARLLGRQPIGWLQLSHRRGRLATALAGVGFANLLVFMQLGFFGALVASIAIPYDGMNADLLIQSSDANTLQDGSPIPRNRMLQAAAVPGVAAATAVYYGRIEWKQPDGTVRAIDVLGIDPMARALRSPEVARQLGLIALADVALIDRRSRNVPRALFDEIDAGQSYRIEANNRGITIAGTFTLGGGFGADGYLVVSDQTFLRLFKNRRAGAPNYVLLRAAPGERAPDLAARLNAHLPASDVIVRTMAEAVAKDTAFQTTQKPAGIIFGFGTFIGALVGIVIVYQILATDVADHLKEYATFKAIGYRQRFFLGIVLEEAVILGVLGFIPGLLCSLGLYAVIAAATGLPLVMTLGRAAAVLAGTIVMSVVSGLIATRRLAQADPAELF
jgi:putative ABC transport system permease protein